MALPKVFQALKNRARPGSDRVVSGTVPGMRWLLSAAGLLLAGCASNEPADSGPDMEPMEQAPAVDSGSSDDMAAMMDNVRTMKAMKALQEAGLDNPGDCATNLHKSYLVIQR